MSATTAAKVLNDPERVAYEMIEGFVASNPHVVRLDGFPDIKVIRRKELNLTHVSVICGAPT
jgi:dihydroxyacetone kinase